MFHSRIRKATAQARPVRMSGVALTSVSEKTPICRTTSAQSGHRPPRVAADQARMHRAEMSEGDDAATESPGEASGESRARGSMRSDRADDRTRRGVSWTLSVCGDARLRSPAAALPDRRSSSDPWWNRCPSTIAGDPAFVDHRDPVLQRQDLIQLFARSADRRARRARAQQQAVDRLDRRRHPARAWLHRDHDARLAMISRARISRWRLPPESSRARVSTLGRRDLILVLEPLGLARGDLLSTDQPRAIGAWPYSSSSGCR